MATMKQSAMKECGVAYTFCSHKEKRIHEMTGKSTHETTEVKGGTRAASGGTQVSKSSQFSCIDFESIPSIGAHPPIHSDPTGREVEVVAVVASNDVVTVQHVRCSLVTGHKKKTNRRNATPLVNAKKVEKKKKCFRKAIVVVTQFSR